MDETRPVARRLERLRAACAEEGLDAFFVRDTSNIRWLTAFDDVFDDEDAHALLVTPDAAALHTDSRYAEAARVAAAHEGAVEVDAERKTHAAFAAARMRGAVPGGASFDGPFDSGGFAASAQDDEGLRHPERSEAPTSRHPERSEAESKDPSKTPAILSLGIEDSLTLADYRALEAAFADAPARPDLRETSGFVRRLRAVKEPAEVVRMKAAQAVTDAAFAHIVGFMRPGLTERAVQIELEDFMRRHGAEDLAFPSIVATGANGASPHAIPGDAVLEAGQCVVLDFGARKRGYCSDMTRTVFLGEPDERLRAAYEAIREANERVQALLRPGVTGKEAHDLAERVLGERGFGGAMGHSLGHGVGIDIHEEPNLSPRNDAPLAAGNVVTVEPGIYLPGEFGMRLEDFGVLTESGFDVFTQSTHDMVIL